MEKCIGCEKQFSEDKISTNSGEPMCESCENEFHNEVKDHGLRKIDEYLEARGLKDDFNIFCQAKFSCLTEEEVCEVSEHIDEPYKRWKLSDLTKKP